MTNASPISSAVLVLLVTHVEWYQQWKQRETLVQNIKEITLLI